MLHRWASLERIGTTRLGSVVAYACDIKQQKLRDDLLKRMIVETLLEAKVLIERRRGESNCIRPHCPLDLGPPALEAMLSIGASLVPEVHGIMIEVLRTVGLRIHRECEKVWLDGNGSPSVHHGASISSIAITGLVEPRTLMNAHCIKL